MGTRITFITEPILNNDERVKQLEIDLAKYQADEGEYFQWQKHIFRETLIYFSGCLKKHDTSFYEWHTITSVDIRVVWISDEGTNGIHGD